MLAAVDGERVRTLGRRREPQAVHDELVGRGFEGSVLKSRDGRY